MVAPLHSNYSNKKGIYKDLYREIDADYKKKKSDIDSNVKRPKKGIYVELYKQIDFRNREQLNDQSNLYFLAFKKLIKDTLSRVSYFFSMATGELKMLIVACTFAKKTINGYIENNLVIYSSQGIYYNDR